MPVHPRLAAALNQFLKSGCQTVPDDISPLKTLQSAVLTNRQHPTEPLPPLLKASLLTILRNYLSNLPPDTLPSKYQQSWLAGLLLAEQYLLPLDDPLPPADVRRRLTQIDYLTSDWDLSVDLATAIVVAAQQMPERTYFNRRREGLSLLATALEAWAGSPATPPAIIAPPPRPCETPPLTVYYTPRPALHHRLITRLNAGSGVALVGLGGSGKSTLALWLAREIASDFTGGVIWLNEVADVSEAQRRLGRSLGVTLTGVTPAERAAQLRTLLAERRCLLILDNVWDAPDLPHLQVVGPDSQLVVTSRDYQVAARLQLPLIDVGRLTAAEGADLLTSWGGPGDYGPLIEALAGHPLALTLVGALLRSRQVTLAEVMALLATPTGSTTLDHIGTYDSLTRCFDVSYERLSPADQLFLAQLSCFSGSFDQAGAAAVMGTTAVVTLGHLSRLRGQALLERDGSGYRLHDLVRDYADQKLVARAELATATHRRHAVYFIRHYLYHPGVLDDDQATAPNLDEVWSEVVAGVSWAVQHEPRLAAIAVVLAHTERAALLADSGEPLLAAVKAYAVTTTEVAERAVLAEMLADLAIGQSGSEAGLLWQGQGNQLAASYVSLRQAGVQLLQADPAAALVAVQQALQFLTQAEPVTTATLETWRWLYYWFDALLSLLVRRPDCAPEIPVTLRQIAQKSGYDILIGRGWHLERLWWSAPGVTRLETDHQRQTVAALSVQAWYTWRRGGERDKADREVTWSRYELRGRFSRRTARRYGRRLSRLTPRLTAAQQQLLSDPALRWWVRATETQRLAWFERMYPRYLRVVGQRPLFPRGRVWVEAIETGGAWGVQARRWGTINLPTRSELAQAERFLFSGIKPMPLLDLSHQQVAVNYLAELSQ